MIGSNTRSARESRPAGDAVDVGIDTALAQRSPAAVFAYLLLLVIVLGVTSVARTHMVAASTAFASVALLTSVRLFVARAFTTAYPTAPGRWAIAFRTTTLLAGAAWGIGCATLTHLTGWTAESVLVLVTTAGATAGSAMALSPSLRLVRAYVTCMLLPTVVGTVVFGAHTRLELAFALILALYLVFLFAQTRQLHDAFVLAIERSHLLEVRTRIISERSASMRFVLDNVDQGFLGVRLDGSIASERSAIVDTWLGPPAEGETIWEYLSRSSPDFGAWVKLGWAQIEARAIPVELAIAQIPRRLVLGDRILDVTCRALGDRPPENGFLMVISDVTNEELRAQSEETNREAMSVVHHAHHDYAGLSSFLVEAQELLATFDSCSTASNAARRRALHTLKGNAASFGLERLARVAGRIESESEDAPANEVTVEQRVALTACLEETLRRIEPIVVARRGKLDVEIADYEKLVGALRTGASSGDVLALVDDWALEPAERRLRHLAEQATTLAHRLGKSIRTEVESNALRLPTDEWGPIWASLVHVVRNAVDHGFEPTAERVAAGKDPVGVLRLRAAPVGELVEVSIADDGRGIDWPAVRARARALGLEDASVESLAEAVFADGLTTADRISDASGHGIGMGATRAAVEALGGQVTLASSASGTTFRARIPRRLAVRAAHRSETYETSSAEERIDRRSVEAS
ncbi:MAG TPA: ATP-binding protein [Polyangiaceae bacterium]